MLIIVGISQARESVGYRQRNGHQSHQTGEENKGEQASSKKTEFRLGHTETDSIRHMHLQIKKEAKVRHKSGRSLA